MRNENDGIFVGPGDGKDLTNPIGGVMVVKVRDGYTDGAFSGARGLPGWHHTFRA